jgi:hypothetical protein
MAKVQTPSYTVFPSDSGIEKSVTGSETHNNYLGNWEHLYEQAVLAGDVVSFRRKFYKAVSGVASMTVTYNTELPEDDDNWEEYSPYAAYAIAYEDTTNLYSAPSYIIVKDVASDKLFRTIVLHLLPSEYSGAVKHIAVFRKLRGEDDFYYIDKTTVKGRLVLEDNGLPRQFLMPDMEPDIERYPDSIRWTTIGSSSQIPLAALENVQFGDGDEITGMAVIYGNLIVFKNNSIHRISFNAPDVNFPISRSDIVSPDVGCIAPRTIITVNNTVYFLSWHGFYSYDNNQLVAVDGPFAVELRQRLHTIRESWTSNSSSAPISLREKSPDIELCSSAYNQQYNEIYLNVPIRFNPTAVHNPDVPDGNVFKKEGEPPTEPTWESTNYAPDDEQFAEYSNYPCVYVIGLTGGYATKFIYSGTNRYAPASHARLYHTNSIGELRSGRITQSFGDTENTDITLTLGTRWRSPAEMFIESPTNGMDEDQYTRPIPSPLGGNNLRFYGYYPAKYPVENTGLVFMSKPILGIVRSKFFGSTGDNFRFRLRKLILEWLRSRDSNRQGVHLLTYPMVYRDEKLNDFKRRPMVQSFLNIPKSKATTGNILTFTPDEVGRSIGKWVREEGAARDLGSRIADYLDYDIFLEMEDDGPREDDIMGKPIHFAFDMVSEGRSELFGYSLYTRPIHTYLM